MTAMLLKIIKSSACLCNTFYFLHFMALYFLYDIVLFYVLAIFSCPIQYFWCHNILLLRIVLDLYNARASSVCVTLHSRVSIHLLYLQLSIVWVNVPNFIECHLFVTKILHKRQYTYFMSYENVFPGNGKFMRVLD